MIVRKYESAETHLEVWVENSGADRITNFQIYDPDKSISIELDNQDVIDLIKQLNYFLLDNG